MNNVTIRKGRPEDAKDFARLVFFTAPEYFGEIFGSKTSFVLERLFRDHKNIFSFNHSYFMEADGRVAGMTLFYDSDQKNKGIVPFILILLRCMKFELFKRLGSLLRFGSIFARIKKGDLYSSNTALYPEFRGCGLGEKLFCLSGEKARDSGYRRVVVDIKADNRVAIGLREKLGYRIVEKLPVLKMNGKTFEYVKMIKELTPLL